MICIFACTCLYAQDPFYSQLYSAQLYYNPGFTGCYGAPRIALNHRNEFSGLGSAFQTTQIYADHYIQPIHGGVGVSLLYDNNDDGQQITKSAGISYAYHHEFGAFGIQPGIQAGYTFKNLDHYFPDTVTGLPFYGIQDPYGRVFSPVGDNIAYPEIGAGILLYDKSFITGLSVFHLNSPAVPYIGNLKGRIPMRFVYHVGYNIALKEDVKLSPAIIFTTQDKFMLLMVSASMNYKGLLAGIGWYKNFYASGSALHVKVGGIYESLLVSYNFDLFISDDFEKPLGIHEIAIQLFLSSGRPKNISALEIGAY
ncbi:MAG: PorP/SprF family type IX secretion system membrane protein [Bacteroidetes bacterium]|nr:PorP/SprF family type IX secretion system membrane protein [Bacteroidota bacterium]